ncbi:hypothetical protein EI982_10945 [Haloplanus rallus]|jgi:hypothetical protein|uniref:Uncharacterized protein n=1 Tax=Haloplanus rallus TaxID=1816183 RepID=A0A6B9F9Y8_9EURY|nr:MULTISPECIES: DUF5810 domain-containing protein [Haloplanus]QGX95274.1 hypothetical protein EI982_10945 [Haloplanus rallus]
MGFACPVCETPQRDAEHLANHLAFTAMLHGDAHERWLDETVPGWESDGAAELAPVVADHAEETPYDEVFEESMPADRHDGHDHAPPTGGATAFEAADLDPEAQRTLAAAKEMTRAMLGEGDGDADDDGKA